MFFEFLDVVVGTYQLEITYIGYQKFSKEVTVIAGKNTNVSLVLLPGTEELGEIIILGDRLRGQAKAINKQKSNQTSFPKFGGSGGHRFMGVA